ncbi:MAG: hypothetical protein IAB08_10025, partial [Bacteroidetes bacterium]|nr:hypothetical protein [Candidatus Pullibacteroides excrementavium]
PIFKPIFRIVERPARETFTFPFLAKGLATETLAAKTLFSRRKVPTTEFRIPISETAFTGRFPIAAFKRAFFPPECLGVVGLVFPITCNKWISTRTLPEIIPTTPALRTPAEVSSVIASVSSAPRPIRIVCHYFELLPHTKAKPLVWPKRENLKAGKSTTFLQNMKIGIPQALRKNCRTGSRKD